MAILHTHRQTMIFIEHAKVFVEANRVEYSMSETGVTKTWNVPSANTSFLLLGNGASISTAAMRILSEDNVLVGHCGGGGAPLYMAPFSEYRPTETLQKWIRFWPDEHARLAVAKFLAEKRCDAVENACETGPAASVYAGAMVTRPIQIFRTKLLRAGSVTELMGHEANFAMALYSAVASATGLSWDRRDNSKKRDGKDDPNKLLDDGNYVAYGIAGVALWCLGLVPQLPVTHGQTRAGGLVFDIADIVKDALVLPCAFESAVAGMRPGADFRQKIVTWFDDAHALDVMLRVVREAAEVGTQFLAERPT